MTVIEVSLAGLGVVVLCATALWIFSVRITNASIVDIFWGTGFAIVNLVYFALTQGDPTRKLLLLILVTVWGLRLSVHIGRRNMGHGEDYRYQKFRAHYGAERYWWVSYFQVFLLQGGLLWLISSSLLVSHYHSTPAALTIFDIIGFVVWLVGFLFEAVGDWQLSRFKSNPANKGKVLDTGLWRYTRHPNYFGDAVLWWGFFLIALGMPGGFLTIFSPLMMTFLLVRVSGVAMLERNLKKTKPEYQEYVRRTSAFFPMPPRK